MSKDYSELCQTFKIELFAKIVFKKKTKYFRKKLNPRSLFFLNTFLKVGLSPSKKNCFICLIESPLKMIKNAFYFILKALFVLKKFKFLSRLFGHVRKTV